MYSQLLAVFFFGRAVMFSVLWEKDRQQCRQSLCLQSNVLIVRK